jgi:hypothetical protein
MPWAPTDGCRLSQICFLQMRALLGMDANEDFANALISGFLSEIEARCFLLGEGALSHIRIFRCKHRLHLARLDSL